MSLYLVFHPFWRILEVCPQCEILTGEKEWKYFKSDMRHMFKV
jgi:hypothetical protein